MSHASSGVAVSDPGCRSMGKAPDHGPNTMDVDADAASIRLSDTWLRQARMERTKTTAWYWWRCNCRLVSARRRATLLEDEADRELTMGNSSGKTHGRVSDAPADKVHSSTTAGDDGWSDWAGTRCTAAPTEIGRSRWLCSECVGKKVTNVLAPRTCTCSQIKLDISGANMRPNNACNCGGRDLK